MEYLEFITEELILFTIVYTIVVLVLNSIWLHSKGLEPCKEWVKEFISERWDRWKSRSGLKRTYYVLASIVVSIFFYSFWFIFPEFLDKIDDGDTSFYNLSLAVFAILSGFGAVFGFYTSIIKTETAEQGQITDRLNKAIENLGKITEKGDPVIEVRIGALFALERIAQDSIRDHIQIMEILCAYIRHNSPLPNNTDKTDVPNMTTEINSKRRKNKGDIIDEDIQTAITIIGRRDKWPEGEKRIKKENKERYRINLDGCYLHSAKFSRGNLANATLIGANLSYAWFNDTDLSYAALGSAILVDAWLERTTLKNTEFRNTTITTGAHARDGDFSDCLTFTPEQINKMFFGAGVELADGLDHPQEGTDYYKTYNTLKDFFTAYRKWQKETGN